MFPQSSVSVFFFFSSPARDCGAEGSAAEESWQTQGDRLIGKQTGGTGRGEGPGEPPYLKHVTPPSIRPHYHGWDSKEPLIFQTKVQIKPIGRNQHLKSSTGSADECQPPVLGLFSCNALGYLTIFRKTNQHSISASLCASVGEGSFSGEGSSRASAGGQRRQLNGRASESQGRVSVGRRRGGLRMETPQRGDRHLKGRVKEDPFIFI